MNWWVDRQRKDPFVKKRDQLQRRSRASFKLEEIIERFKLKNNKGPFLDLGCAPGGWSEVLVESYPQQLVIGCDLLETSPVEGAILLQGDFTCDEFQLRLAQNLNGQKAQGIFSDISPNKSGQAIVEQMQHYEITLQIIKFANRYLGVGGFIVQKIFHGHQFEEVCALYKKHFGKVSIFKPKSSRQESSEVFLVAKGYMPNK